MPAHERQRAKAVLQVLSAEQSARRRLREELEA